MSASDTFFWVLWVAELLFMLWWTLDDMRLTYVPMNPAIFIGWLWLIASLGLFLADVRVIAFVLVCIAGVPLAIMGLFMLVILIASLFGPIRWN
jgi:hypothetical protein